MEERAPKIGALNTVTVRKDTQVSAVMVNFTCNIYSEFYIQNELFHVFTVSESSATP